MQSPGVMLCWDNSLLKAATGPCGYLTSTRTSPQPLLAQPSCRTKNCSFSCVFPNMFGILGS